MKRVLVVHHHEIVLKRDNRRYFEQVLMRNVRSALKEVTPCASVRGGYGRFVIEAESDTVADAMVERLERVFGLANICAGVELDQDMTQIADCAVELLKGREFRSVRVSTKRADKRFPLTSVEVNEQVGARLCTAFGVRANLTKPDETIYVEIVDGVAYVYRSKVKGAGGLPSGSSGRVVALLSAGFDSPVAAWRLMKRGATVSFVHFHSMPYTSKESVEQVRELVSLLTSYQLRSTLHLVPFAETQQEIVLKSPESLRVVLYRRMMLRIAEAIAIREQAEALVTGEAVGQVASQTLRNIRVIESAITYPVLRPLAGNDKEETLDLARRIGTHDISKEPYDDCCSFLAPRRPQTWSSPRDVAEAETHLGVAALVDAALSRTTREVFETAGARLVPDVTVEG